MDPNSALAKLRALVAAPVTEDDVLDNLEDVCEAFTALDEWLTRGGFTPADWQPRRPVLGYRQLTTEAQAERDAAIAARHESITEGQTADGRPYKILPTILTEHELYPKTGTISFNAWPIMVIETGGYNDIEITDPYTGQHLWVGEAWGHNDDDEPSALARALRRAADTIEQSGFGSSS